MHNKQINKEQLDKNLVLLESSLNEVFAKLKYEPSNKILYERAEVTLELASFVRGWLVEKYKCNQYAKEVISKIDNYQTRFEEVKSKFYMSSSVNNKSLQKV